RKVVQTRRLRRKSRRSAWRTRRTGQRSLISIQVLVDSISDLGGHHICILTFQLRLRNERRRLIHFFADKTRCWESLFLICLLPKTRIGAARKVDLAFRQSSWIPQIHLCFAEYTPRARIESLLRKRLCGNVARLRNSITRQTAAVRISLSHDIFKAPLNFLVA